MQVQTEAQLLEGQPIKLENLIDKQKRPLDSYIFYPNSHTIEKILSCPTNSNLIVVYQSFPNQITIFDTRNYSKVERFPLKACDKKFSKQSFVAKCLDFSPDGSRLAIGQSDSVIYIYKLANQTNSMNQNEASNLLKPTITGKFVCLNPITCLLWTEFGIIFGTKDGKIKLITMTTSKHPNDPGQLSTSQAKVVSVYNPTNQSCPIALTLRNSILVVSFTDSSVHLIPMILFNDQLNTTNSDIAMNLDQSMNRKIFNQISFEYSCPVHNLISLSNNIICCSGSNGKLTFYNILTDNINKLESSFGSRAISVECLQTIDIQEDIISIDYSQINEVLAIATRNKLVFVKYDQEYKNWKLENSQLELVNCAILTSVTWNRDGSQLIAGNLNGSLVLFRCTWNKQIFGEQLDICHIAKNRVRIADRERNLLATYKTQYDIKRVNLLDNGQSVIIWTVSSLMLAHLGQNQSEIEWNANDKTVKFCFDYSGFVIIYKVLSQELLLIKLGDDKPRFKYKLNQPINKNTITLRQYPVNNSPLKSPNSSNKSSPHRQRSANSARQLRRNSSISNQNFNPTSILNVDQQQTNMLISEQNSNVESINERFVFLNDYLNLILIDLKTQERINLHQHKKTILWLEFSYTGDYLIFIDSDKSLHLIVINDNNSKKDFHILIEQCQFANWVHETDILVAQSREKILIWYDLKMGVNQITKLDSRSFNPNGCPPIIDLSLKSINMEYERSFPVIAQINAHSLSLSNGYNINLDKTKVEFYREVLKMNGLTMAMEYLQTNSKINSNNDNKQTTKPSNLWYKLGWLALEKGRCDVGIRCFQMVGFVSMLNYLENCQNKPEECNSLLLKLLGDWPKFETLVEQNEVISTYKRLNKWSRLIDFLLRNQQFKQRDLAEIEFKQWLISNGRYLEAANIQAKTGDLLGAVELLEKNGKLSGAADLLVTEQKMPLKNHKITTQSDINLVEVAKRLKYKLIQEEIFSKAAIICDKILNEHSEAIEFYMKDKNFENALDLAKEFELTRVTEIQKLLGLNQLELFRCNKLSRSKAIAAIDHLIGADCKIEALNGAIELKCFDQALRILKSLEGTQAENNTFDLAEVSKTIGAAMVTSGKLEPAIEAFSVGKHYDQVILLQVELEKYKDAFDTSLNYLERNREASVKKFIQIAKSLNDVKKAESIYLTIDEPDLAIDMHKEMRNFDRMLELIEEYHPDLLEGSLLQLAKEFENEGNLMSAENYLLKANECEWTSVVRMYRLAGKWDQAFRVARQRCTSEQDPLLIQLAYWWTKSLMKNTKSFSEAGKLLNELNLFKQVVEFCCENKNFQTALDLCECNENMSPLISDNNEQLKSDIVERYANYLEHEHKYKQAEKVLVRYGKVELATKMYIDNEMLDDAIRVAEEKQMNVTNLEGFDSKYGDKLLNETLIECANKLAESAYRELKNDRKFGNKNGVEKERSLELAQQMYLRAQRPELAVEMYTNLERWQEAVQVAQRFAPQLVENVERALDAHLAPQLEPILKTSQTFQTHQASKLITSDRELEQNLVSKGDIKLKDTSAGIEDTSLLKSGRDFVFANNSIDQLHSDTQNSIQTGNFRATKHALSKLMDSILDGDEQLPLNEPGDWLSELEQISGRRLDGSLVGQSAKRQLELTDLIVASCSYGNWTDLANEDGSGGGSGSGARANIAYSSASLWSRLREALWASVARQTSSIEAAELDRRLLLAHFVSLREILFERLLLELRENGRLVNRPNLANLERLRIEFSACSNGGNLSELLAKLSLSLLRYVDLLEAQNVFYEAGFWLLASGRRQLARVIWTRLLESEQTATNSSQVEDQLRLQEVTNLRGTKLAHGSMTKPQATGSQRSTKDKTNQLNQVRAYLVNSLIESEGAFVSGLLGGASKMVNNLIVSSSEEGRFLEAILNSKESSEVFDWPACLICGYPMKTLQPQIKYPIHSSEWLLLKSINEQLELELKQNKMSRLSEQIEFNENSSKFIIMKEQFNNNTALFNAAMRFMNEFGSIVK